MKLSINYLLCQKNQLRIIYNFYSSVLLVAFGGFVFRFDTGTISGSVNMSDYLERFGELNADGEYFLSNVRTGLIVAIFNVGCAVGGIFLSKIADVYGRKYGLCFP